MIDRRDKTKVFFHRIASEEDILTDGPCRNRLKLLVHHSDTLTQRVHRVLDHSRLSINVDLSFIHLVNAEHAFHQCGLSGTVFTHQSVDFSGTQLQLNMIQRFDTRERFAYITHLKEIF